MFNFTCTFPKLEPTLYSSNGSLLKWLKLEGQLRAPTQGFDKFTGNILFWKVLGSPCLLSSEFPCYAEAPGRIDARQEGPQFKSPLYTYNKNTSSHYRMHRNSRVSIYSGDLKSILVWVWNGQKEETWLGRQVKFLIDQ